jgi:hypothetical protein
MAPKNNEHSGLVEYLFVDDLRLRDLAEQLRVHRTTEDAAGVEAMMGLTSLGIGIKRAFNFRDSSRHEMIERVVGCMDALDELGRKRPESGNDSPDNKPHYILEEMTARKIIVPTSNSAAVKGLRDMAVWVSDPIEPLVPGKYKNDWETKDAYVYLVEAYWEDDGTGYHGLFSAFSALDFIFRILAEPLSLDQSWYRHNPASWDRSPRELLAAIGGIEQRPRRIKSLYYKRLVSNDQYVRVGSEVCRCLDVLGYPVFIAAV